MGEVLRDLTATGAHRLRVQAAGTVAGTNQRAGHDSREAHVISSLGVCHELLRAHPTLDRVVHGGRAQVLGNREDIGASLAQVTHGLHDLLLGLAHAQDQVGLRDQPVVVGRTDDLQGTLVLEGRADALEDARHGLQVVGEDLRLGLEHDLQQLRLIGEVRGEVLHARVRVQLVDLADDLRVQPGALVVQVVAGHARDGGVLQAHLADGLRHAARLVAVQGSGLTGLNLAEVATAGAGIATDEEGGLAVLPALVDIRAASLLAHRVQAHARHAVFHVPILGAHLRGGADPAGLSLDGGLRVLSFDAEHPASVSADSHGVHPTLVPR